MTVEIHTIILKFALRYVLSNLSDEDVFETLSGLIGIEDKNLLEEWIEWCIENPVYPDPEHEKIMEYLRLVYSDIKGE